MLPALAITINIDPEIGKLGPFLITWHGLFTAVGIAVAVVLVAYFAARRGVLEDDIYNIALWAVPGGIIGARLLYVVEHANTFFPQNFAGIFAINEGGISIYGGLIGGALAGWAYARFKHLPMRRISDAAAMGMIMGQTIGRLGDFINGEHWAKASNLPWAFCYTNPKALVYGPPFPDNSCGPVPYYTHGVHPVAGLYEPLALLLLFGVCLWLRQFLKKEGYVFWAYVLGYSAIRFGLSGLRVNEQMVHWSVLPAHVITVPQICALVMAVLAVGAIFYIRRLPMEEPKQAAPAAPLPARPRAVRRA